jgi:L-alanine-DL-glutamate epimerase-like enolase superfamily enzyme
LRIIDIRELAIPLKSSLRNAVFDFSEMSTSVVAVKTDARRDGKPVIGYAFNSTGRYACGAQMRERFIPRLLAAPPESLLDETGENLDPEKALACMSRREKPGGHSERSIPIGTIEVAIWDAVAKIAEKPLHDVLARRYGTEAMQQVPCYVGGGWYEPGKGIPELRDEIQSRLDEGYTTMKIKVGGASLKEDLARVEAAIGVVGGGRHLAVDANAGFSRTQCFDYAAALDPYGLRWLEEPTDPIDFATLAELTQQYNGAIGSGENLYSTQDVHNLVRFGAMRADRDIIQIDVPQSYGIAQFARSVAMLESMGWARQSIFPHGGNLMTLAVVTGFGLGGCEAYPGVFGIFAGFADDARVENGMLRPSDRPGIGFEGQNQLYAVMQSIFA